METAKHTDASANTVHEPLTPPKASGALATAPSPVASADQLDVLVVDDSKMQRQALRSLLEKNGYRVTTASNGREGLDLLNEERPSLVISDVVMPGLDGYELCRRIKQSDDLGDIPVILLTSLSDPSDVLRGLECGADNFLCKPYDDQSLLARLRFFFANKELGAHSRAAIGIELSLAGRKHFITSERVQILDLLVSSYEKAARENEELAGMNRELMLAIERIGRLEGNQRALLDNTGDSMVVLDRQGIVRYVNPAAETLFGFPSKSLCGHPLDCPIEIGETLEVKITRPRGAPRSAEVRAAEILYESSTATLATFHDITERKQVFRLLRQTQREREEMRDQFLSHVSHELRSPIASINNFLQLMLRGDDTLPDEHREYLEIASKNTHQLSGMIEDLVEATRAQTGVLPLAPTRASVAAVIHDVLETVAPKAAKSTIELTEELPGDLPAVLADPARIRQVVINLVENAIKFTPAEGCITVSAKPIRSAPGKPFTAVRVAVGDTGCGIPAEDCTRIFDRMYQVAPSSEEGSKGLGLGLHICRELVLRHGGQIWAESEEGAGSTFFFTLPLFSIESFLAAVVNREHLRRARAATLIAITLQRKDRARLESPDIRQIDAAHKALTSLILRPPDVTLPRLGRSETGEVFTLLAWQIDEPGIDALVRRIRDTFEGGGILSRGTLELSLSHTTFDDLGGDLDQSRHELSESIESALASLARNLGSATRASAPSPSEVRPRAR